MASEDYEGSDRSLTEDEDLEGTEPEDEESPEEEPLEQEAIHQSPSSGPPRPAFTRPLGPDSSPLSEEVLNDPNSVPCHHNFPSPTEVAIPSLQDAVSVYQACLTLHVLPRLEARVSEVSQAGSLSLEAIQRESANETTDLAARVDKMNSILQQVAGFQGNKHKPPAE